MPKISSSSAHAQANDDNTDGGDDARAERINRLLTEDHPSKKQAETRD
jgi:hypothetical protein